MRENYGWEVETLDHKVIRQYNEDGSENPSSSIPAEQVVRASLIPRVPYLPRHDVLVDHNRGEHFVRRFARGLMQDRGEGIKHKEYLQVIVTTNYRLWVFSTDGRCIVANPDLEVYP